MMMYRIHNLLSFSKDEVEGHAYNCQSKSSQCQCVICSCQSHLVGMYYLYWGAVRGNTI